MPVRQRDKSWQVTVEIAEAMSGYRRIRKSYRSEEEARQKECEIDKAIRTFGHWPIKPDARPLLNPIRAKGDKPQENTSGEGTIKEASKLAIKTHWAGTPYGAKVESYVNYVVDFLTKTQGRRNLDDLTSADIDALVAQCRKDENVSSTINAKLSALSVIMELATERSPPLCLSPIKIKRVAKTRTKKWWLNLEDMDKALRFCRKEAGLMIMGDYIEFICNTGIRVEEALRTRKADFINLKEAGKTSLLVDGTKTDGARKPIALNEAAAKIARRRLEASDTLFPVTYGQLADAWNAVREHLGYSDVPTATLKALRRTFAKITELKGMPTTTLQRILRHGSITTTQGYLDLVGTSDDDDAARRYL